MNPPFLPPSFPPGPPTTPAWESGPGNFVRYNGSNQTAFINTAKPPPPAELGVGPADPNISNVHVQAPAGNGYGPVGQGTIGVGNPVTVPPQGFPAQIRTYVGPDGNLYFLENQTGEVFSAPGTEAFEPQPPVYSPTK